MLATIWTNLGSILLAVVLVLVFKAAVTGILLRMMGARRSTAAETGILMASPSETTLIVLAAAGSAALIQPGTAQFWQIVTAIGLTVTPLLARLGRVIARRVEPAPELEEIDHSKPPVIIIGIGRVGRLIAQMLDAHGKPYMAVDSDADMIERAKRKGYRATFGDAARGDAMNRLGIDRSPGVVLTMDEPVLAERLTRKHGHGEGRHRGDELRKSIGKCNAEQHGHHQMKPAYQPQATGIVSQQPCLKTGSLMTQ